MISPPKEHLTETGEIAGSRFRIDIPENWNGVLVMFAHGFRAIHSGYTGPPSYPVFPTTPDGRGPVTGAGFALAQAGYAKQGFALREGTLDIENLRSYFISKSSLLQ